MKRRLAMLVLPSLLVVSGCAGSDDTTTPAAADTEQALIGMIHDWTGAVVKGDTGRIDEILADDFLATLPDGRVMSKKQSIEEIALGDYKVSALTVTSADARVFGDAAVVTFGQTETSHTGPADTSGRSLWTDVFVKRNGRWQIVAEQGTRIDAPAL